MMGSRKTLDKRPFEKAYTVYKAYKAFRAYTGCRVCRVV